MTTGKIHAIIRSISYLILHNEWGAMNEIATVSNHPIAIRATTDDMLIDIWLRNKESAHTRKNYRASVEQFRQFVNNKALSQVSLEDLLEYKEHLAKTYRSRATQAAKLDAIKSLLTFGQESGYLAFNVGAAVKSAKVPNTLAERILSEEQVLQLVNAPKRQRDRLLLRLLYASGGRVSEIASLKWKDVQPNGQSGQITVTGKGEKTRAILLRSETYKMLLGLKPEDAEHNDFVFLSQRNKAEKNGLDDTAILRIVQNAGEAIGISGVSPHWLRHSHASHALDRGASIVTVKETLGHSNISVTNKYLHAKPTDSSALHLAI